MFGIYFRSSLGALAWLVLLPMAFFVLYVFVVDPNIIEDYFFSDKKIEQVYILLSMIASIVVNFFFLMIIPAAAGGISSGAKRGQFYLGFFINLFAAMALSIIYYYFFGMEDVGYFAIILAFHILGFMLPFIFGALFVAPAYARAFWFVDRNRNK